ncbi:uncharacterized protein A4U43_C08F830 [Asparagus officinalis]|nr:uncharacterized protein A4U43_C08F830 [Asparagus officinalis]
MIQYSTDSPEKSKCYNDIDSGLWGEKCMASMMERENCSLRCLSRSCYDLIYKNDPLEEGERDQVRRQEYSYCMRRVQGYGNQLIVTNTGGYFTISQDHQSG